MARGVASSGRTRFMDAVAEGSPLNGRLQGRSVGASPPKAAQLPQTTMRQRQVLLILDVADDLLEKVLERDHAENVVARVTDERHVLLRLLEQAQRIGDLLVGLEVDCRVERVLEYHDVRNAEKEEQVLRVDDADDVVGLLLVNGQARVPR